MNQELNTVIILKIMNQRLILVVNMYVTLHLVSVITLLTTEEVQTVHAVQLDNAAALLRYAKYPSSWRNKLTDMSM